MSGGWLSAHLFFEGGMYGPECDRVVLDVAEPFVLRCRREEWTDGHFFIRYGEGGPHVRLRLRGAEEVLQGLVWPALVEHVPAALRVERVPYEPETVRYGGPDALQVAERHFADSSETAYRLLAGIGTGRSSRLGRGLLAMVVLVHAFAGDRDRGAAFARMYATGYLRLLGERDEGGALLGAFGDGYQRQAGRLAEHVDEVWSRLDAGEPLSDELDAWAAALRERRAELAALFRERRVQVEGRPAEEWERVVSGIVPSYAHMTNNRLGITLQEESYLAYLIARALVPGAAEAA